MSVAPARRQGEVLRDTSTELHRELFEVGRARATPAVDRLVRIAHRHDGMTGEHLGEQPGLNDAGVLILVEQDHAELRTEIIGHRGHLAHDLEGERHLVRVFDEAPVRLELGEALGQSHEHGERSDSLRKAHRLGALVLVGGKLREGGELLAHGDDPVRVHDVLAHRTAQVHHGLGDDVDVLAEIGEPLVRRGDDNAAR